jgi:spore photoproduct lyase
MSIFDSVLVEKDILRSARVEKILSFLGPIPVFEIDSYEKWWAQVHKPYLDKREKLNLILAEKKGDLVKRAPPAYGLTKGKHYYFIHAYNCIYECQYCYLQGHFKNPDLVVFVNHEEIINEMVNICSQGPHPVWFHAGEFSDSLALSHLTQELPLYWQFASENENAFLELRTKSVNIKEVLQLGPHPRIVTSFSLSPQRASKEFDLKTPPTSLRIESMKKLAGRGFKLGVHFDPIVFSKDYEEEYQKLIEEISTETLLRQTEYISIGVVRFSKDAFDVFARNYPDSSILRSPLRKEAKDKVKYTKELRNRILSTLEEMLVKKGYPKEKIYWCME